MSNIVAIQDIADVNPRIGNSLSSPKNRKVTFLPMAAISENGTFNFQEERKLEDVNKGFSYFQEGDILLAKITPCMENGKAVYASNLIQPIGFGSTEFHVIRPGNEIDGRYLFYMVWNPYFRRIAEKNMTGSAGQKRVPVDFVRNFRIPLPTLPEQKRIVAILDKADRIRRKRQETIRLLDELLRSVFLEMFGDPVRNEKGWEIGTIGDLTLKTQYGTSQKATKAKSTYPVLRMNNINYDGSWDFSSLKYINLDKKDLDKYMIRQGELLFNRTNSKELVGKAAVYREETPMAFAGYLIKLIPNQKANTEFISAYLNSSYGKKTLFSMAKNIVGMANINAEELKNIKIMLPPIELQNIYAEIVINVSEKENLYKKSYTEMENNINCLMWKAFRGEL